MDLKKVLCKEDGAFLLWDHYLVMATDIHQKRHFWH